MKIRDNQWNMNIRKKWWDTNGTSIKEPIVPLYPHWLILDFAQTSRVNHTMGFNKGLFIEYNKNIMMTFDDYVIKIELNIFKIMTYKWTWIIP
jgi:hypothetical protein